MKRTYPFLLLVALVGAAVILGCASRETDPRCEIIAPNEKYRGNLAQSINGSPFWKAYFKEVAGAATSPVMRVELRMERRVTYRSSGGDYDPGNIDITFEVTNLRNRQRLYREEKTKKLDDMIFGNFGPNPSREDIQRAAFEAAEEDVFPFLDRWINIAALRAIGQEGAKGQAFIPMLEEESQNPWAEDLMSEARRALQNIKGGN